MNEMDENMEKQRLEYVDMLRFFACFLVILTHSVIPGKGNLVTSLMTFLGSQASDLFISLSGAVLLPLDVGFFVFYKKRFMKLLPPVVFWSIVILGIFFLLGKYTFTQALDTFFMLPFKPVVGVYWFVYVLVGLYLFAPFISPWLKCATRKQVEFFLLIWSFNMIIPWVKIFVPNFIEGFGNHYWALNLFAGFLGYWVLGYYLRNYPIEIGLNYRWVVVAFGFVLYLIAVPLLKYLGIASTVSTASHLQIGSAFFVVMFYTLAQNIKLPRFLVPIITEVAQLSFGIYLIHILIERELIWKVLGVFNFSLVSNAILTSLLTFVVCYAVVKMLSLLPFHKYTIGV